MTLQAKEKNFNMGLIRLHLAVSSGDCHGCIDCCVCSVCMLRQRGTTMTRRSSFWTPWNKYSTRWDSQTPHSLLSSSPLSFCSSVNVCPSQFLFVCRLSVCRAWNWMKKTIHISSVIYIGFVMYNVFNFLERGSSWQPTFKGRHSPLSVRPALELFQLWEILRDRVECIWALMSTYIISSCTELNCIDF